MTLIKKQLHTQPFFVAPIFTDSNIKNSKSIKEDKGHYEKTLYIIIVLKCINTDLQNGSKHFFCSQDFRTILISTCKNTDHAASVFNKQNSSWITALCETHRAQKEAGLLKSNDTSVI